MRKKTFPCGHKGKGKYCHRCEQENKRSEIEKSSKEADDQWKKLFETDPINLRPLLRRNLIEKARKIISGIEKGIHYSKYKGKIMRYNRNVISIPINHDFRLILHRTKNGIIVKDLMDHESYNIKKPGEKA